MIWYLSMFFSFQTLMVTPSTGEWQPSPRPSLFFGISGLVLNLPPAYSLRNAVTSIPRVTHTSLKSFNISDFSPLTSLVLPHFK